MATWMRCHQLRQQNQWRQRCGIKLQRRVKVGWLGGSCRYCQMLWVRRVLSYSKLSNKQATLYVVISFVIYWHSVLFALYNLQPLMDPDITDQLTPLTKSRVWSWLQEADNLRHLGPKSLTFGASLYENRQKALSFSFRGSFPLTPSPWPTTRVLPLDPTGGSSPDSHYRCELRPCHLHPSPFGKSIYWHPVLFAKYAQMCIQ